MVDYRSEYVHTNDQQWFGRRRQRRPQHIERLINEGYPGLFGDWFGYDDDCVNFIMEQMERNGIPINDGTVSAAHAGAHQGLSFVSWSDPYVLFTRGLSDVKMADDWHECTYQIPKTMPNGRTIMIEPEFDEVEAFSLDIAQGEWVFREFLKRPFLDLEPALYGAGRIERYVDGKPVYKAEPHALHDIAVGLADWAIRELNECGPDELLGEDEYRILEQTCSYVQDASGEVITDYERLEFICIFAAWAAFVWVLSPRSRKWRCEQSGIIHAVHEEGEAITIGITDVFGRSQYNKFRRPAQSCYQCEVESWCLTTIFAENTWLHICNACDSRGLPVRPPANCGSKLCRMPQCRHHPFFIFPSERRLHESLRKDGLLTAKTGQNPLLAARQAEQKLLQ